MGPVSCVSCVSWMYCVDAAETHETFNWESGMRYHAHTTISCSDRSSETAISCGIDGTQRCKSQML